jgi:DNA-directed RNA polymerase specialized sigma subunit
MSILTNKISNLTENAKVLILSKLEEGWSIRRVAHYYNIAKSTVQRIKQTLLWCSKISTRFYVVKLT